MEFSRKRFNDLYYVLAEHDSVNRWIVFIHGIGSNHTVFDKALNHFYSEGYNVLAVDLLGHGRSKKPLADKHYAINNMASKVRQVINHEKIKDFVLVGHSLGGMLTVKIAAVNKVKPEGIVIIDSLIRNPWGGMAKYYQKFFQYAIKKGTGVIKNPTLKVNFELPSKYTKFSRFLKTMSNTYWKAYFLLFDYALKADLSVDASKLEMPALILHGSFDIITPVWSALDIAKNIKDSRVVIINGAGHIVLYSQPQLVNQEIDKFLRELS
ncbi:alpha/beta hydrolase [Candidatus Woesearchaeota archaeon]|nr:alpha/beta hydrolase [Candidatus Woesearchaeota archaeon]